MIEEQNGNNPINVKLSSSTVVPIASSQSNDDLSLSTSEYTDADEMSAPTEYLAEVSSKFFWSFVFFLCARSMLSDRLYYCIVPFLMTLTA